MFYHKPTTHDTIVWHTTISDVLVPNWMSHSAGIYVTQVDLKFRPVASQTHQTKVVLPQPAHKVFLLKALLNLERAPIDFLLLQATKSSIVSSSIDWSRLFSCAWLGFSYCARYSEYVSSKSVHCTLSLIGVVWLTSWPRIASLTEKQYTVTFVYVLRRNRIAKDSRSIAGKHIVFSTAG